MTDDFNDMISHFPDDDSEWTENQWKAFLKGLVSQGLVSYKEVASCVLGMLNPPQVGTSIASNASFKSHYPKRKCWETVRNWFYSQTGNVLTVIQG
jgi:hypothetical protein